MSDDRDRDRDEAAAAAAAASATTSTGAPLHSPASSPLGALTSASALATGARKLVIKVGSASLSTADGRHPNLTTICSLVELICALMNAGHRVVLVTSGAVSIGCQRLQLKTRPTSLITKQAVAAVGQSRLMRIYDDMFSQLSQPIAQVLLTRDNLNMRHHYTNARNTFAELMSMGIVPIVNENDTVAVEELRVGDNDTLSAMVASLVEADFLFLATDVEALYTANPRLDSTAKPIREVHSIDDTMRQVSLGDAGSWGTGGMATKIQAARIATSAGVTCGIVKATQMDHIPRMMAGELVGTRFYPVARPIRGHKKWIAHGLAPQGVLYLDAGAVQAIQHKKSLFAAGVTRVVGSFHAQSCVRLLDASDYEVGRGLCNYGSEEMEKLKGSHSLRMKEILGYDGQEEVVHRNSLALTGEVHDD